jgi:hypothetical protein
MASNFNFIESGVVFGIRNFQEVKKIHFKAKDFSLHGDAFTFVLDFFDDNNEAPPVSLVSSKFPDLDEDAIGTSFDYCLQEFSKEVLYLRAKEIIEDHASELHTDPSNAIAGIQAGLDDINFDLGSDVLVYDSGRTDRYDEYARRKSLRTSTKLKKVQGVITPFRTINRQGMGWMPGDVISLFAKTSVGKTWLTSMAAAIAVKYNHKTLYFSPEMTDDQMFLRFDVLLSNLHNYEFSHSALRRGEDINDEEYKEYLRKISKGNLLFFNSFTSDFITLETVVSEVRKHKPELLVIDGLDLLWESKKNTAVWEKMVNLFAGLKQLSVSSGMATFVSTQALLRSDDLYEMPRLTEAAYGAALIRNSDTALTMCLSADYPGKHRIKIQKSRHDEIGFDDMILDWEVNVGRIRETDGI